MQINKSWSFSEAMSNINASFEPGSQLSGRARNLSIEHWAQLVGKHIAQNEIQSVENNAATDAPMYEPNGEMKSVADELLKWSKLKEDGHISDDEFDQAKTKLLREILK